MTYVSAKESLAESPDVRTLFNQIRSFLRNDDGPTAVEYAVMLAAILMVVIGTVRQIGSTSGGIWTNNNQKMEDAGMK